MPWFWQILLLMVFLTTSSFTIYANETEKELLQDTALLAEEVREFGKTMGIQPTGALSKVSSEATPHSMISIWIQKKGTLALYRPIDITLQLTFSDEKEKIPVSGISFWDDGQYSFFYRTTNQFAREESVITAAFARRPKWRKIETIFHEALHGNLSLVWENEESLVTPLAYFAAEKFLEEKGHHIALKDLRRETEETRKLSRELNDLAKEALKIFSAAAEPLEEARKKVQRLILSYLTYALFCGCQSQLDILEARLSHDLAYYKYFDRIASLYEKMGDLTMLVEDLKKAPSDTETLEKFLGELELRYERPIP